MTSNDLAAVSAAADSPIDEPGRLAALDRFGILDTPPEAAFDDVTRLAGQICRAPIAVINLIAGDRQWFKSELGLGIRETPLDISLCVQVFLQPGLTVIPDLAADPRFAANPLVTADNGLRFYAGVPLITRDGFPLGTLCVLDHGARPEGLTDDQALLLRTLAGQVMNQLELKLALRERELAERELASSQARQQQIVDSAQDYAIIATDLDGVVTSWSAGATGIFGWRPDEAIGMSASRFYLDADIAEGAPLADRETALATGRCMQERWLRRRDGERFWASGEWMPLVNEVGIPCGYAQILRDRTPQRLVEGRLQAEATRHADLLETQKRVAAIDSDFDAMLDTVVQGALRMMENADGAVFLTHEGDQLRYRIVAGVLTDHRDLLLPIEGSLAGRCFAEGGPLRSADTRVDPQVNREVARKVGARSLLALPVRHHGRLFGALQLQSSQLDAFSDRDLLLGQLLVAALVTSLGDVAQLKTSRALRASERALRDSEARFEAIANSIEPLVWSTRPNGIVEYFNRRWYEFSGLAADTPVEQIWGRLLHPEDRPAEQAAWAKARANGTPMEIELRLMHRSGRYRWVLARSLPVRDEAGDVTQWFGSCSDIQDIVEARELLARDQEDLSRRFEKSARDHDRLWRLSPDLLIIAGFDGVVTAANPSTRTILGRNEDDLPGAKLLDFVHPEDSVATQAELLRAAETMRAAIFVNRYRHGDGSYRYLSWTVVPEQQRLHAIGRDITAERDAAQALETVEDALRHSQKMQAIGQLTGGIAHDFNNLLAGISGNLELLQRRIAAGHSAGCEKYIDSALASSARAAALTHRLLAFARRQSLDAKPLDVNARVTSIEDLLRRTMGETIVIHTDLDPAVWAAFADPNQFESALLNLAINARDAMPDGGRLSIETRNVSLNRAYTQSYEGLEPGDFVVLRVRDSGFGMPRDVRERAFEPFFTTKPIGQGTGLGLSMIYGFVTQSGGHATIDSAPGEGASISLYLPRCVDQDAAADHQPYTQLPRARSGETILVVEDDEAVRMLVLEVLQDLGYTAIEAGDAPGALRILDGDPRVDLLVTDVGLPGMNGRQLAEIARQRRPGLKILFVTGYAEGAEVRGGFLAEGMEMISKPFAIDALAGHVRRMIETG